MDREGEVVMHKGHDWSATVRYVEARRPPGVALAYCHDDGRPIPPGARCYRRVDARQGYPLICLPCHEKIEHQRYKHANPACAGCGEPLQWAGDGWVHPDQSIWKMRVEACAKCGGKGCRYCGQRGTVHVQDHEAAP